MADGSGICHAHAMAEPSSPEVVPVPWSARAPQRYVFAVIAVVIGLAVVVTALAYIRAGTGGVVPFLMITVGPILTIVYVYYFGFRKFDQAD
jgi:drug/metabolite transporter (DMT)-like permease